MEQDTTITNSDPNDYIFLTIHWGDILIQDLEEAQHRINNVINKEIENIHVAQADLRHELPEKYSSPWHLDSSRRHLINNNSGFYQDP